MRHKIMAVGNMKIKSSRAMFLQLGSTKVFQRFRQTKMRNGGRVFLAVLNLYGDIRH